MESGISDVIVFLSLLHHVFKIIMTYGLPIQFQFGSMYRRGSCNHSSSNDSNDHKIDEKEQTVLVVRGGAACIAVDCSQYSHHKRQESGTTGQNNKETQAGNLKHVFPANLETRQPRWPLSSVNLRHSSNRGSLQGTDSENGESSEEKPDA